MNITNISFFLFQQLAVLAEAVHLQLVHHEHLLNLLNLLLQPLLQVVIMRAVTHLIVLTLLLQEQLQQMVREKSENIMNISEMK